MNKNIPTRFKNLLKDCSPTVKEYMESIMLGLIDTYGEIDPSYYSSLQLLRDNYEIYNTCYQDIKKNGPVEVDSQGRRVKNKNFTCLWESTRNIMALSKAFCFTPAMKTRMKAISKGQNEKSPLDDFLNSED